MEYSYKMISELGRVVTGKTPPTENEEYYGGSYPFITPSDIHSYDEKYLSKTERTISEDGARIMKGMRLLPKSICFVCIGSTIGKMCMTDSLSYSNQQINTLIPNKEYDCDYLFYYLRYLKSYFQLIGGGTGSGKGIVNKSLFSKTKISVLAEKTDQQRIGAILSAYDNLIEVNNKRIKVLEQMAEHLYKEWFVRFRFPGHETAEFENGIPKGWELVRLGSIASITTGKSNRQDADEKGIYPFFDRSQEVKKSNIWLKDCEAIIVPGEGTSFFPKYYKGKFDLHQRCYCVEPKQSGIGMFLYYVLLLNRHYFLSVATGATVPSLRLNNFVSMKFIMPQKDICKRFNEMVSDMIRQIEFYNKENEKLSQQRDLLLPRLMSGKLEV